MPKPQQAWTEKKQPEPPKLVGTPDVPAVVDFELARRRDEALELWRARVPSYLQYSAKALAERIASPAVVEAVQRWHPSLHGNLLILGATGVGKSAAGGLLFPRLMGMGIRDSSFWPIACGMRWVDAEELEREVRTHGRGRGEVASFTQAVDASILFLDEVGSEPDRQNVTDIIAMRYKRRRPTIIMSGQTPDGLTESYKAPVVRKMRLALGRSPVVIQHFDKKAPAIIDWPDDDLQEFERTSQRNGYR